MDQKSCMTSITSLDTFEIDYIMAGEGEIALDKLLTCLENKEEVCLQGVSTKEKRDDRLIPPVDLSYLETLDASHRIDRRHASRRGAGDRVLVSRNADARCCGRCGKDRIAHPSGADADRRPRRGRPIDLMENARCNA